MSIYNEDSGADGSLTYVTVTDQTSALPNSRMLVGGTNITLSTSVGGQIVINASGSASGDVTGPASSVAHGLTSYADTTGKLLEAISTISVGANNTLTSAAGTPFTIASATDENINISPGGTGGVSLFSTVVQQVSSASGSPMGLGIIHNSNSSGSSASYSTLVAGASSGNAYALYGNVGASKYYSLGYETSTGNFKISCAATLGTNNAFSLTSAGAATFTGRVNINSSQVSGGIFIGGNLLQSVGADLTIASGTGNIGFEGSYLNNIAGLQFQGDFDPGNITGQLTTNTTDVIITATDANANINLTPTGSGTTIATGNFNATGNSVLAGSTLVLGAVSYTVPTTQSADTFLKNDGSGVLTWSSAGGGSGDVTGPGSSTANAISVWSDTSGTALLNTPVIVDPSTGDTSGLGDITWTASGGGNVIGQLTSDTTDVTLSSTSANANITLTPTGSGSAGVNGDFGVAGTTTFTGQGVFQSGGGIVLPVGGGGSGMVGTGTYGGAGTAVITTSDCDAGTFVFITNVTALAVPSVVNNGDGTFTVTSPAGATDSGRTFNWLLINANT